MDFLLNAVTKVLNTASAALPGFTFLHNIAADIGAIMPYLQKANAILPMDTLLAVMGLGLAVNLALLAYYWITRAINLIRGAG